MACSRRRPVESCAAAAEAARSPDEQASDSLMPRGERSQTWFPELVAELRESWRHDLSWDAVIDLRNRLQRRLEQVLSSRGIRPAKVRCLHCGHVGPGAPPVISVRAVLLALRRFRIESEATVRRLDKEWAKHRTLHQLDLNGYLADHSADAHHAHAHHKHAEERA